MSAQPTPTHPAPANARDHGPGQGTSTNTDHLRAVLHDLVDLGASLAGAVHAQAMAQAEIRLEANAPESVRDATAARTATLTAAFDRVARCVRRTVLLAQHLDHPPTPAKTHGQGLNPSARTQARTRLIRGVETAIDRAAYDGRTPDHDALRRELLERLDSPSLDDDLAARPMPEIIAEICEDMGISYPMPFTCPPRRRTPADIEALRTEAQAPPDTLRTLPFRPTPPPQPSAKRDQKDLKEMMDLCAMLAPEGKKSG